jgi:hypothetical protein
MRISRSQCKQYCLHKQIIWKWTVRLWLWRAFNCNWAFSWNICASAIWLCIDWQRKFLILFYNKNNFNLIIGFVYSSCCLSHMDSSHNRNSRPLIALTKLIFYVNKTLKHMWSLACIFLLSFVSHVKREWAVFFFFIFTITVRESNFFFIKKLCGEELLH